MNSQMADKYFGPENAKRFRSFLSDLKASASILDIPGVDHMLVEIGAFCLVNLDEKLSLKVFPNHKDTPLLKDGLVDWNSVFRLKLEIV